MKHILLTTLAAVLLVGCGPQPPDISIDDAARDGNIEAIKQHLAAGTDVNAKADGELTPLHFAADKGHKEIVELLIAKGADVNAINNDGETPLDSAIKCNHPETADLLRKHGAKTGKALGYRCRLNQPTPPLERRRVVVRGATLNLKVLENGL